MLSRNFSLNSSSSSRDYDNLKQQCDKAVSELTLLKRQHSETARRCDHAMKVGNDVSELRWLFYLRIFRSWIIIVANIEQL